MSAKATNVASQNRRRQTRHAVHCRVVAISADDQDGFVQPVSVEARAEDVSRGGARLLTNTPFASSRLWLRFSGVDGATELIECRVVRAETQGSDDTREYMYGLRFRTDLTEEQLARLVKIAAVPESA